MASYSSDTITDSFQESPTGSLFHTTVVSPQKIKIIPLSVLENSQMTTNRSRNSFNQDDNQSARSNVSQRYKKSIIHESSAVKKRLAADYKKSTLNLLQVQADFLTDINITQDPLRLKQQIS